GRRRRRAASASISHGAERSDDHRARGRRPSLQPLDALGLIFENATAMTETRLRPFDHWLFIGTPSDLLAPVAAQGREVPFAVGDVLFREGDPSDGLYIILSGSVRVSAADERGEIQVAIARRNEVVGEMGVLDGEPRSATVTAAEPGSAYFLPSRPIIALLEQSPITCMRLMAILARKLRETNASIADVAGVASAEHVSQALAADSVEASTEPPRNRSETRSYLERALPLMDRIDGHFRRWLEIATADSHTLTLPRDPNGQQAASYLWRVSRDARDFTLFPPPPPARRLYEAVLLALAAREAAARLFRDAAQSAPIKNPRNGIAASNRKILEAERQWNRAWGLRQQLDRSLDTPPRRKRGWSAIWSALIGRDAEQGGSAQTGSPRTEPAPSSARAVEPTPARGGEAAPAPRRGPGAPATAPVERLTGQNGRVAHPPIQPEQEERVARTRPPSRAGADPARLALIVSLQEREHLVRSSPALARVTSESRFALEGVHREREWSDAILSMVTPTKAERAHAEIRLPRICETRSTGMATVVASRESLAVPIQLRAE